MEILVGEAELGQPIQALQPYWAYSEWGEVATSDPRLFPALYFLKGANSNACAVP